MLLSFLLFSSALFPLRSRSFVSMQNKQEFSRFKGKVTERERKLESKSGIGEEKLDF